MEDADEFNKLMKTKNRIIGNLKFTGGLITEGLVSRNVVFMVVDDLVEKKTDFHYECLCTFWGVVQETLLTEAMKADAVGGFKMKVLNKMEVIKGIVADTAALKIKPRTKFMLVELIEKYNTLVSQKKQAESARE